MLSWCVLLQLPSLLAAAQWGIVLDCGSSGTRLHMYFWDDPRGPVREHRPDNATLDIEPGISSFAATPDQLGRYIQPLLDTAARAVPEEAQSTTRLLAQATAGMRLLTAAQQERIWAALSSRFRDTPFLFVDGDALTISGNYEGLYGWMAASYLANVRYGSGAFGYLDLGGASTQIAFVPDGASPSLLQDAYRVRQGRESARVYAHSYMRSGQNEAMERLLEALPGAGQRTSLYCPCFNEGYQVTRELCGPSGECAMTTIRGAGNWSACSALATALLHNDYECLLPPCAAFGVYQPNTTDVRFVASSGYFYAAAGLGLIKQGCPTNLTRESFVKAGNSFCGQPWALVNTSHYASMYCFLSAYVPSLLSAFGLGGEDRHVEYAGSLGGSEVSWALGSQLYEIAEQDREIADAGSRLRAQRASLDTPRP